MPPSATFPYDATPTLRLWRGSSTDVVTTQRMPKVELSELLVRSGRVRPIRDAELRRETEPRPIRKGIPRYRPPPFPRIYAALRFGWPSLFAVLRVAVLIRALQQV